MRRTICMGGIRMSDFCAGGSALRASYFLLLRQKKVSKENATPGYAVGVADCPALLEAPGGCGTRRYAAQTVLAESPRHFCVARRSTWGPRKASGVKHRMFLMEIAVDREKPEKNGSLLELGRFSRPLGRGRATQGLAEKGRGLSEARRAEFRSPRQVRVAQGTRAAGDDPGSPSFCLLFLGEARKSKARLKREKQRFNK